MAVETLLTRRLGPVAGKLHTARSRNDQVATDIRLYVKDAIADTQAQARGLAADPARPRRAAPGHAAARHDPLAARPARAPGPSPARLLLDAGPRRRAAGRRAPAGGPAAPGGGRAGRDDFPINRQQVADELGFAGIVANSLDAVSDRDFAIETVAALSILMMHLSRLSEELILWNSPAFGWVEMGDNVTTGSSIMPQKKNPDVAELTRGKAGRVFGDLVGLLTLMKSLPLAYNKDMQEDKEPLFDALRHGATSAWRAMNTLLQNTTFRTDRMAAALRGDFSTATDLADYLVRQGLPFRQAHEVVGKLVAQCLSSGRGLEDLTSDELAAASALFAGADAASLTSPRGSADARESAGGTGRAAVDAQLTQARDHLAVFSPPPESGAGRHP